jgi:ATP-binding protein involved in chromosome partitioning
MLMSQMDKECDGKCESCSEVGSCADPRKEQFLEQQALTVRMGKIKHKVAVISGKGGVGKSTVTVNLAVAFAMHGYADAVGVLDADIHGPCVPKMLGLQGQRLQGSPAGMFPVVGPLGIRVVSMDFLLASDDVPVIWRGPLKMRAIQQFLADVVWGELEYLLVDLPPGTGDEPLSVMQLIPKMDGVIVVTIPSEVSQVVVKKAVTFARQLGVPVIGIIENMSGFVCPKCGTKTDIFARGSAQTMARDLDVPFLGTVPIDPQVSRDSDSGKPFIAKSENSPTAKAFAAITGKIEHFLQRNEQSNKPADPSQRRSRRSK